MSICEFLERNVAKVATSSFVVGAVNLLIMAISAVNDGTLTDEELHTILKASNGYETIALAIIVVVLKFKTMK